MNALFEAIEKEDHDAIAEYHALGKDLNASSDQGVTPLNFAIRSGRTAVACQLILLGADVNAGNRNGTTPLMFAKTEAFRNGNFEILRLLVEHGACRDQEDINGLTVVDYIKQRTKLLYDFFEIE